MFLVNLRLTFKVRLSLFSLLVVGCNEKQPKAEPPAADLLPAFADDLMMPDSLLLLPIYPADHFDCIQPQMEIIDPKWHLYTEPAKLKMENLD